MPPVCQSVSLPAVFRDLGMRRTVACLSVAAQQTGSDVSVSCIDPRCREGAVRVMMSIASMDGRVSFTPHFAPAYHVWSMEGGGSPEVLWITSCSATSIFRFVNAAIDAADELLAATRRVDLSICDLADHMNRMSSS
jgi:hypothetical protein